jgi:predicted DNA-binding protein (UPF0251 family)
MPRPRKWRKVCCLPESDTFGPLNEDRKDREIIIMSVEEYETIRLIDLEGLTQEECAKNMNVARTTVQRIYNDARKKNAQSLVNGAIIKIEGGDYKVCEKGTAEKGCGMCRKKNMRKKDDDCENSNTGE